MPRLQLRRYRWTHIARLHTRHEITSAVRDPLFIGEGRIHCAKGEGQNIRVYPRRGGESPRKCEVLGVPRCKNGRFGSKIMTLSIRLDGKESLATPTNALGLETTPVVGKVCGMFEKRRE